MSYRGQLKLAKGSTKTRSGCIESTQCWSITWQWRAVLCTCALLQSTTSPRQTNCLLTMLSATSPSNSEFPPLKQTSKSLKRTPICTVPRLCQVLSPVSRKQQEGGDMAVCSLLEAGNCNLVGFSLHRTGLWEIYSFYIVAGTLFAVLN